MGRVVLVWFDNPFVKEPKNETSSFYWSEISTEERKESHRYSTIQRSIAQRSKIKWMKKILWKVHFQFIAMTMQMRTTKRKREMRSHWEEEEEETSGEVGTCSRSFLRFRTPFALGGIQRSLSSILCFFFSSSCSSFSLSHSLSQGRRRMLSFFHSLSCRTFCASLQIHFCLRRTPKDYLLPSFTTTPDCHFAITCRRTNSGMTRKRTRVQTARHVFLTRLTTACHQSSGECHLRRSKSSTALWLSWQGMGIRIDLQWQENFTGALQGGHSLRWQGNAQGCLSLSNETWLLARRIARLLTSLMTRLTRILEVFFLLWISHLFNKLDLFRLLLHPRRDQSQRQVANDRQWWSVDGDVSRNDMRICRCDSHREERSHNHECMWTRLVENIPFPLPDMRKTNGERNTSCLPRQKRRTSWGQGGHVTWDSGRGGGIGISFDFLVFGFGGNSGKGKGGIGSWQRRAHVWERNLTCEFARRASAVVTPVTRSRRMMTGGRMCANLATFGRFGCSLHPTGNWRWDREMSYPIWKFLHKHMTVWHSTDKAGIDPSDTERDSDDSRSEVSNCKSLHTANNLPRNTWSQSTLEGEPRTFLLQEWREQFRNFPHFFPHKNSLEHWVVFPESPQRHFFSATKRQGGQLPWWQRSAQKWSPHERGFPQVWPQVGVDWSQGRVCSQRQRGNAVTFFPTGTFPRKSSRTRSTRSQMTYLSLDQQTNFHTSSHLWCWQERVFPQGFPQRNFPSAHFRVCWLFPQRQVCWLVCGHSPQGPSWHVSVQGCFPQWRVFPQVLPHEKSFFPHLRTSWDFPQKHRAVTVWGQGGHRSGWQSNKHLWPHRGWRARWHVWPHLV